ncbi:MAG: ATP-grasp domain-containing protein [Intestinimonas sp.]|jgi:D-aspartate ligase|nr:ATP-grasp domain-containing protein [Intestinimonas sp.]
METKIFPLLFGGDINVYSVARAFHEAYGIKSTAYGKFATGPCYGSAILDYRVCAKNEDGPTFFKNVCDFAAEHSESPVLLLGCGDSYVRLAAEYLGQYPGNVVAPYISGEQMDQLINKEHFYTLCDEYGIDYPATFVYRPEMGHHFKLPFEAPYICKPANGVAYWEHPFEGNKKVFKLSDRRVLEATLDKVYAAGYPDSMIIQEFIPGDDSYMRVLTNYSDAEGGVKLMCLGHVLLEEHTPHGIGNHAVILTEPNEELCRTLQGFLEALHFTGFSNFDIKFDQRDRKYKVFEINCRQGRSNFYVTGAGHNIARLLVEDRLEHKPMDFTIAREHSLWTVVPFKVAYDYTPRQYHAEMRELISAGKVTNPLRYEADRGLRRRLQVAKNQLGHFIKFKKYYDRPN